MTEGTSSTQWRQPPRTTNEAGQERRVGVELEFNGLSVREAANVVADSFGGAVTVVSKQRCRVEGAWPGPFLCELDVKFAHRERDSDLGKRIRDMLARASAEVLPIEIVCPPMPWTQAHHLDALRATLMDRGARGTRASPFFAYGVQLNPELPALDVGTIISGLRAFIALRGWLRQRIDVDLSRRMWFFEGSFPESYCEKVMDLAYAPDLDKFIDDYLADNPTRNRELDLLPLLAHLDEPRVRDVLPDETIKARPTWHYRLPNSDIDAPDWSLGLEWARWMAVERLADDPDALQDARRAWLNGARSDAPGDADLITPKEKTVSLS